MSVCSLETLGHRKTVALKRSRNEKTIRTPLLSLTVSQSMKTRPKAKIGVWWGSGIEEGGKNALSAKVKPERLGIKSPTCCCLV